MCQEICPPEDHHEKMKELRRSYFDRQQKIKKKKNLKQIAVSLTRSKSKIVQILFQADEKKKKKKKNKR